MDNKRTVQRNHGKRRGKPKVRFNFGVLIIIFFLSFAACFTLYMLAANFNDDFFKDEFDQTLISTQDQMNSSEEASVNNITASGSGENSGITNPVPQSEAADAAYLDGCTLVTDITLADMAEKSSFKDVIADASLGAASCNDVKITSSYGSQTIYDTMKVKKPSTLYIMLGSDLGTSTVDDMISSYTSLVNNLHAALPEMKIYLMQLPPVIYDTETVTNSLVNEYNTRLLDLASASGVYCIDTNTPLKSGNGALDEAYWSYDTLSLGDAGYAKVCDIILTHVA